jgi:hypothetical protein
LEASQTTQPTLTAVPSPPQHEQCDQCGAAVDSAQRYCVACGAHRRHVRDPASRYLATRNSRARGSAGGRPPSAGTRRGGPSLLTAVIVAAVPLAIGLGVLVGRSSNNNDAKLLAALRNQKSQVVTTASTGSSTPVTDTASTSGKVSSTFPRQDGYAVELQTLPAAGTTTSDISSAESAARAKKAPQVGLIVQTQYTVTPKPASGAYVIYAGAYKTKTEATQELSKLKGKFSKAVVIQVQSTTSGANASNVTAAGAKVVARTKYGVVHNVVGYHPNAAAEQAGGQIVNKIQKEIGKSYTNAQKGLPDVIPVP